MIKKFKMYCSKYDRNLIFSLIDFLFNYILYGCSINEYFGYRFYDKNKNEKKKYAVFRIIMCFYRKVNKKDKDLFFDNKPEFLIKFAKYIGRDFYTPDMDNFKLKLLCKNNEILFVKPVSGNGGKGIYVIKTDDINNIDDFINNLIKNHMYVETPIKQCKYLDEVNSSSVNTIRAITFRNNNEVEILFTALRIGNGESVDNLSSGGMVLKVDEKTGKCNNIAYDRMGNIYEQHPVSEKQFNNLIIPNWCNVKKLIKKLALEADYTPVIGWDVALTDNGPVVIEGNRDPGFGIIQYSCNCGRKDIIEYVYKNIKR